VANERPAFIDQLLRFWQSLSRVRKVALVGITLLVLGGVIAISVLGSQVRYATLFRGLDTEDASAIMGRLKDMKVPTRLDPSGTAIEVPEAQVHELRLELAGAGLPRGGGVGFEIFDKAELGTTQFEQQIKLRRALEGELARSVGTLEGVISARVHLVIPENRIFTHPSDSASASVIIKLRPGYSFGPREVGGIVHLVSSAVPGLTKDRLTVVSTDGRTLHSPGAENNEGEGFDVTRNQQSLLMARSMEDKVRTLLERVAGLGGVDVRVHIELHGESRERTEERYDPTKTVVRSEHKSSESTAQEAASVAGVPGAQTNLPDIDPSVASREEDRDGNLFRRSQTRNFEVDRTTERIKTPPGAIERVSVAVLIDGTYEEKDGVQVYTPRSSEELQSLEAIARSAVGFDEGRGDTLRIESARFKKLDEKGLDAPSFWERYGRFLPYAIAVLGLITLLAIFAIFMRSLKAHERKLEALAAGETAGALEGEAATGQPGEDGEGPESATEPEAPPDPALTEARRLQALELAAASPATAALVLGAWLSEADPVATETAGEATAEEAAS
jgi:flagellar M-ring protein FliF